MASSLIIPEEYEAGYAKLIALDESVIEQFTEVLRAAPMVLRPIDLASTIAEHLAGSIEDDDVYEIIQMLVSLYPVEDDFESNEQLAEEICEAVVESDSEKLSLPEGDRERFKQRLIKLLDIDSVRVASKANVLLHEYERVVCNARVMTDIRPVFGVSPDAPPKAALIVHTLKINYHDAEGLKEFYVAMDSDEMDQLMYVLDRADAKSKSLRAVLDAAKLPHVDAE
jgi:hypothetical protein